MEKSRRLEKYDRLFVQKRISRFLMSFLPVFVAFCILAFLQYLEL